MSETLLSSRNLAFELYEVLDAEGLTERERFAEHNRETFDAAISTARSIAEKYFAPHNRKNDENEPRYEDGKAILIPDVKPAVDAFLEAGFLNAARSFDAGGMQLPTLLSQACFAHFQSANAASTSYPFLTMGAANLIESFGTEAQKQRFLQPMIEGRFFGTMALTEPHAGSSLSDIRTRAEPAADGSYRLKGNKIFISGGDHPLSENIVHMVLAKLPDAPAGVKGISLFIVPKFLVNEDGSLGARNDVLLAGLFHKMGWRGTTSTALNFGDNGNCVGYLVGQPHQGLSCMFQMMNEARIGVGMGAVMLGYAGYLYSLEYARERPQGRLPDSKDPGTAPVSIIQHADIKRMLLTQKAYVEGAFDLGLYAARLFDDTTTLETDTERAATRLHERAQTHGRSQAEQRHGEQDGLQGVCRIEHGVRNGNERANQHRSDEAGHKERHDRRALRGGSGCGAVRQGDGVPAVRNDRGDGNDRRQHQHPGELDDDGHRECCRSGDLCRRNDLAHVVHTGTDPVSELQ